jgi:hypothetical protein
MFHIPPPLLLSDFEWFGGVAGVVALVAWVIRQIVEANKQAAPAKPGPVPLRNQVEEFLRRAGRVPQAEKAGADPRRARPVGTSEIELLVDDEAPRSERGPLAEPLRKQQTSAAPLSQPAKGSRTPRPARKNNLQRRETVAEHVAENVASHSRAVADQASRLGQRIIEDDHQFDVQLKAKFDHTVGTLTGSAVTAAEQAAAAAADAATPAAQIAATLANPEGVRQAIVLNEILHRPVGRW